MSRWHSRFGVSLGLWAAAILVTVPLYCAEQADTMPAWELSCGLRLSDSSGLGYTSPGYGLWCWRDHRGEKWTVRTEVLGTTAKKAEGNYAGTLLIEERRSIGDGRFWRGVGTEWTWTDAASEWSDRFTLSGGFTDERPDGHGQSATLRLLFPDSTTYQTHGLLIRYESLYPNWRIVVEGSELAFQVANTAGIDEFDRYWGRRISVLFGYRWRPTHTSDPNQATRP